MASRPTLGPEAEKAWGVAHERFRRNFEDKNRSAPEALVRAVNAFLTEASQSCPELLLRYALSEEEKRALLGVTKTTTSFVSGRLGRNLTEEFRSARQKLEESLNG